MKVLEFDWPYMRSSLLILAACLGLCVVIIGTSQSYYRIVNNDYTENRNIYLSNQQDYRSAVEDRRLINQYLKPYTKLEQQGVVGAEHRLFWVEKIKAIAEQLKLKKMVYRIEPQQAFMPDYLQDVGDINVYSSIMSVQMDMLHEEDILYVINKLDQEAPGSFHVNKCKLKRVQEKFVLHPSNTNMLAECELSWFTLYPPEIPVEQVKS